MREPTNLNEFSMVSTAQRPKSISRHGYRQIAPRYQITLIVPLSAAKEHKLRGRGIMLTEGRVQLLSGAGLTRSIGHLPKNLVKPNYMLANYPRRVV
jgi:hypothetical protein